MCGALKAQSSFDEEQKAKKSAFLVLDTRLVVKVN